MSSSLLFCFFCFSLLLLLLPFHRSDEQQRFRLAFGVALLLFRLQHLTMLSTQIAANLHALTSLFSRANTRPVLLPSPTPPHPTPSPNAAYVHIYNNSSNWSFCECAWQCVSCVHICRVPTTIYRYHLVFSAVTQNVKVSSGKLRLCYGINRVVMHTRPRLLKSIMSAR